MAELEKSGAADLFTSVALVLKHSPLAKRSPEVAAASINAFLDCSLLYQTLESASEADCVRLLDRLGQREWPGLSKRFRDRRQLNGITMALKAGHFDVLQWWQFSYRPDTELDDVLVRLLFEHSVKKGQMPVLQWLKARGKFPLASYRQKPLKCGHPQVIQWLLSEKCPAPIQLCMAVSAKTGDWAFVKWVHELGERMLGPAKRWFLVGHHAARLGSFEMVQWMFANRPKDFTEMTLRGAIEGGHLEISQWANDHGLKNQFRILCPQHVEAIDLPMVQWLWSEIQQVDELTAGPWIENLLRNIARLERLDLIEWLCAQGAAVSTYVETVAIRKGDMAMLQRTLTIWPQETYRICLRSAACHGQLEMFKWFHEQQPNAVNSYAMSDAIRNGHLPIVQYIYTHCVQSDWSFSNAAGCAAYEGRLQTLQWLHAHGIHDQVHLSIVASKGHLQVLKYLVLQCGMQCSVYLVAEAATKGHFAMVAWLLEHDPALADGDLVHAALASYRS